MITWAKFSGPERFETRKSDQQPGEGWLEVAGDFQLGDRLEVKDEKVVVLRHDAPKELDPRRTILSAAIPDILLAVADGADLAKEVRKVVEGASGETQR